MARFPEYFEKFNRSKILLLSLLTAGSIWILFLRMTPPAIWEYSKIAESLIKYHRFSYHHLGTEYLSFCPPLYCFLVMLVYLISNHSGQAVIFFQILIYSALSVVIFEIGKNVFDRKTGIIASLLFIFHPAILFYVLKNEHPLILDAFMFAVSLLCIFKLYDSPTSFKKSMICGMVLGLSSLTRGTAVILIPIFIIWIMISFKVSFKKRLSSALLIALFSMLIISPWTLRNYIVHHKFIPIGAASEESLWRGNNPHASGSSYDIYGRTVLYDLSSKDFLNSVYAADEISQKEIFKKAAFDFIKNNPGKTAELFIKKLYYFWWFAPQSGTTYPHLFKTAYQVYYVLLLTLAFLGLWAIRKKQKMDKLYLLIGVLLSISVFQSLFYVECRHRWGIEPILLIFAAKGMTYIKIKPFNIFQ